MTTEELKKFTEIYWDSGSNTDNYIQDLLGLEMQHAKPERRQVDILVLLVGFTPDPLLQSIWVYQPQRTVLLFNYSYGQTDNGELLGADLRGDYRRYLLAMKEKGLLQEGFNVPKKNSDMAVSLKEATPHWVFQTLCQMLLDEQRAGRQIYVDITGAKKNMVAGAMMFADYVDAEISYVDFEEYHPVRRRPYGYTCKIAPQVNPYRILSIRDWTYIRNLYQRYAFRTAAQATRELADKMANGPVSSFFAPEHVAAVKTLGDLFSMLELWDNGDYTAAWKRWEQGTGLETDEADQKNNKSLSLRDQTINFQLPQAIEPLGQAQWPSTDTDSAVDLHRIHKRFKNGGGNPQRSIFYNTDLLLAYGYDELQKITQLINANEDYRSGFLRAASLDELLLKARIALLWFEGRLSSHDIEIFEAIIENSSAKGMRKFLRGEWQTLKLRTGEEIRRTSAQPQLAIYWQVPRNATGYVPLDHQAMVDLRNESIHTHLSIPQAIAKAALSIAKAAVADYREQWLLYFQKPSLDPSPWIPDWENLSAASGIKQFLPALPKENDSATAPEEQI